MTTYVDNAFIPARVGQHSSRWCHLTADTRAELHAFAARLGLARSYFQDDKRPGVLTIPGSWHYDVTAGKRAQAVRLGAIEVDHAGLMAVVRRPGREGRDPR